MIKAASVSLFVLTSTCAYPVPRIEKIVPMAGMEACREAAAIINQTNREARYAYCVDTENLEPSYSYYEDNK